MARKMPTARVGGYAAPVDTAGMDPEMKESMKLTQKKGPKKGSNGFVAALRKVLGEKKGR